MGEKGYYANKDRIPSPTQHDSLSELILDRLPGMQVGRYVQVDAVENDMYSCRPFFSYLDEVIELNKGLDGVTFEAYELFIPIISGEQSRHMIVNNGKSNKSPRRAAQEARKARRSVAVTFQDGLRADEERAFDKLTTIRDIVSGCKDEESSEQIRLMYSDLTGDDNNDVDRLRHWGPQIVKISTQIQPFNNGLSMGFPISVDLEYRNSVDEVYNALRTAGYRKGLNSVIDRKNQPFIKILELEESYKTFIKSNKLEIPTPPKLVLLGEIIVENA